jgi:hypothetical protein
MSELREKLIKLKDNPDGKHKPLTGYKEVLKNAPTKRIVDGYPPEHEFKIDEQEETNPNGIQPKKDTLAAPTPAPVPTAEAQPPAPATAPEPATPDMSMEPSLGGDMAAPAQPAPAPAELEKETSEIEAKRVGNEIESKIDSLLSSKLSVLDNLVAKIESMEQKMSQPTIVPAVAEKESHENHPDTVEQENQRTKDEHASKPFDQNLLDFVEQMNKVDDSMLNRPGVNANYDRQYYNHATDKDTVRDSMVHY